MSVTVNTPQQLDSLNYRLSWSSDLADPLFRIYQDGLLIDTTRANSRDFSVSVGESLIVEILDDDSEPQHAFPGRFLLGWYPTGETAFYRIEKENGGTWKKKTTVNEIGQGFYSWRSDFLEDCQLHTYRIIPIGTNGNEGDPVVISALMVRHPSPPDVEYNYEPATRQLTIEEV
jgi:hypothetical protein